MALADVPAVYVIGAPRSGTTWVQLMLGSHPEVATPVELSFFSDFAAPWYGAWDRACAGGAGQIKPAHWGLPAALTEEEFEQALKDVVERVYRSLLAAKPGARTVVEKDPQYCMCVDAIVRTVPRARFIHVLRDGRDVVCSTVRVSESWGSVWAPGRVAGAAGLWRLFTQSALRARSAPGGYMEIRYEDLLGSCRPRRPARGAHLLRHRRRSGGRRGAVRALQLPGAQQVRGPERRPRMDGRSRSRRSRHVVPRRLHRPGSGRYLGVRARA